MFARAPGIGLVACKRILDNALTAAMVRRMAAAIIQLVREKAGEARSRTAFSTTLRRSA